MRSLECSHKASIAQSTYQELLKVREELLLYHKMKQNLAWAHRTMHEFSNKPGTLLARALCGPLTKTYISHTIDSSGKKLASSTTMDSSPDSSPDVDLAI